MKKLIAALAFILLLPTLLVAQVPNFPQTLPASTVVGRLGVSAGPSQAIPFATLRSNLNTGRYPVYLTDVGADSTGVADSTVAFTSAISAAPATGCSIFIPPGTYKLDLSSGAIAVNKTCHIYGAGRDVTKLNVTHATNDVFNVTGTKSELNGFTMTAVGTKTAGAFIKADTIRVHIHDIYMDGAYLGANLTDNSTLSYVRDLECRNVTPHATAAESACIRVGRVGGGNNPNTVTLERIVSADDTPASPQRACVNILSADATQLIEVQCLQGQIGLLINPGSGDGVLSTKVTSSFFDSTTVAGAYITQSGTGNVARVWGVNSWFSGSAGHGVQLDGLGGGLALTGFECVGCQMSLNTFGSGLIASAAWSDVRIVGGCYGQNLRGFDIPAAFVKFSVQNAKIGTCDGFTANTTGIRFGGTSSSQITVQGNDFTGSTTPITITSAFAGASGINIWGNTGYANYAVGDLLYADTTSSLNKLAGVATGNALISGGVGAAPAWGKVGLTTHISGTFTSGGIPYFDSTNTLAGSGLLASNAILRGGGAGAAPAASGITVSGTTITLPGNLIAPGDILKAVDNSQTAFYGGSTFDGGAGIVLYGESHATTPDQIWFANANFTPRLKIFQTGGIATGSASDPGTAGALAVQAFASIGTKIRAAGSAPALSSCGTSPSITGSDLAGEVTMGTGSPTGCVITFNAAYSSAPYCAVTWQATPLASQSYAVSASAITLTQTATSSNKVNYICVARSGG